MFIRYVSVLDLQKFEKFQIQSAIHEDLSFFHEGIQAKKRAMLSKTFNKKSSRFIFVVALWIV